jgi:kinetochore protein Mis13/DSN1
MGAFLFLAAVDYENDDDFQFVRKSKKAKTDNPEPTKKPTRGRPTKERLIKEPVAIPEEEEEQQPQQQQPSPSPPRKATTKRSTRRKPSVDPEPQDDAPSEAKTTAKGKRKGARLPVEEGDDILGEVPTNGASQGRARTKPGSSRAAKLLRESPPQQETAVESAKITLPMSDTPIINRNKEMRKKGNGNRRSSLGTRGRRASSLIDSGQTAIPHKEVNPADFYKHIEAEGLTEPRRMKQLLTWCGERALSEKPRHGSKNAGVIHGGKFVLCHYCKMRQGVR